MNSAECLALLKPVLEDPAIIKIGQNMKYDAKIFARQDVTVDPVDDTMLMSYAMNAGLHNHGMDTLSQEYLGHTPIPIKPLLGVGKSAITFDRVPIDEAVKYAAEDADITLRLWQKFKPLLHVNRVTTVYETMGNEPRNMSQARCGRLLDATLQCLEQWTRARGHCLPKHHLVVHLARDAIFHWSPRSYWVYADEAMNTQVVSLAQSSHIDGFSALREREDPGGM